MPFIIDSGTLFFLNDKGNPVVAYAQGQWLTVVPEVN